MQTHGSDPTITSERLRLDGALEVLDAIQTDLIMRRQQARDQAALEAFDEVLTKTDALIIEYRRRRKAMPAAPSDYASYAFLLDDEGHVHPLPHRIYVALVRGEAAVPEFAGKTLRLAEWYVRVIAETPQTVVNETYVPLTIDQDGRADWSIKPVPGRTQSPAAAWPSSVERERMQALLFE